MKDILTDEQFEEKLNELIQAVKDQDKDAIEKLFNELSESHFTLAILAWS